jgi:serine/threonine-protein kinase
MFGAGDSLGPYTIVRRLGAGAMGEVYQARHRHMARDAAIKVLRAELTEDAEVVSRFFTEARATAAVRHPGIVEIFDCDVHRSGRAFIVMEYLPGQDLARRLAEGGAFAGRWPEVRAIGRQVAGALAAAHAAGIVHRDLKPANVFVINSGSGAEADATPVVKVVDFGIAKLLHRDGAAHSQTQTGHILGTPLYMSPEQARGAKTIDHRTDVYALGCVLFEMITGQPPFVRRGPAEVIVAHLQEPAPRASSLAPSVPPALDELVAQMLAKDPAARPASMADVAARLAEPAPGHVATKLMTSGKPSPGPAPSAPAPPAAAGRGAQLGAKLIERAASTTLGGSASQIAAETEIVARDRKRAPWPAIAGAAALVVVGGIVAMTRSGGHAAAPAAAVAPPAPSAVTPSAPAAAPAGRRIAITSQPAGAEVWIDAETAARGRTPLTLELAAAQSASATLRASGYDPVTVSLDASSTGARHVVLPASAAAPPPAKSRPTPRKHRSEPEFKAIED